MQENSGSFKINVNGLLFFITFVMKSLGDAFLANHISENWDNSKYAVILFSLLLESLQLIFIVKNNHRSMIFKKELAGYFAVAFIFFVISAFLIVSTTWGKFSPELALELFDFILPATYVYFLINTTSFDAIYHSMKWILIWSFVIYLFVEKGIRFFTWTDFQSISFAESYSPFESSYSSGTAVACLTFFSYYRRDKKLVLLSFIFTFLVFKRVSLLLSIIFLFLPILLDANMKISKWWAWGLGSLFIVLTLIGYHSFQPGVFQQVNWQYNINLNDLFMGRVDYFSTLMHRGYNSYGLGSTIDFWGINIELDFIKIYTEIGIIGLTALIVLLWSLTQGNIYCTVLILYNSINLLTSHSLTSPFSWIIYLLTIGCIHYRQAESLQYERPCKKCLDLNKEVERRSCYEQSL